MLRCSSWFILPAVVGSGPAGGGVMKFLLVKTKFGPYFPALGGLTVLSGIFMYWWDASRSNGAFYSSPMGMTLGVGGLAGVIALIFGGAVVGRAIGRHGDDLPGGRRAGRPAHGRADRRAHDASGQGRLGRQDRAAAAAHRGDRDGHRALRLIRTSIEGRRMIRSRCCAALLCVTALSAAAAQETPTERDAARDVVRKLDSLEKSLNLPALVAKLTGPNAARDQVAARAKELMDTELLAMGDDITKHPEIGFEEKRSVQILTDYLKKHDFTVQMGTPGLPTAFVARYTKSTGSPNLGVILEYDALRGTKGAFHGDQHSTQGPIGIAAAVAIAEYLTKTKTPGTVTVFGTPGEEMMPPNAKTVMFDVARLRRRGHSGAQPFDDA